MKLDLEMIITEAREEDVVFIALFSLLLLSFPKKCV